MSTSENSNSVHCVQTNASQNQSERIEQDSNIPESPIECKGEKTQFYENKSEMSDVTDSQEEVLLTYNQAIESEEKEQWLKAIQSEKDSLMKNDTWVYVDEEVTKGKQVLTSRWVFSVKADGKFKARLVAKGCQQKADSVDFKEVFSPVVETMSARTLIAIAAQKNYQIRTFDVKTAFLYGTLETETFMRVPEGFNELGKVCLLKKSLYGLRQAPQRWNKRLTDFLKSVGLVQLNTSMHFQNS